MVLIFYQLFQNTWYIQKTNGSHLLSVISEYLIHTKNKWFSSSISYFRILCKYKKQMVLIFYQLFQNTWYIQKTNGSHLLSVISEYLIHTKNKWFSSSISYFRILDTYKKQMVLIFLWHIISYLIFIKWKTKNTTLSEQF
jgi:PIN domain nuclease of toxin-antitoxin system